MSKAGTRYSSESVVITGFAPDATLKTALDAVARERYSSFIGRLVNIVTSANRTVGTSAVDAIAEGEIVEIHRSGSTYELSVLLYGKSGTKLVAYEGSPTRGQVAATGADPLKVKGHATVGFGKIISLDDPTGYVEILY